MDLGGICPLYRAQRSGNTGIEMFGITRPYSPVPSFPSCSNTEVSWEECRHRPPRASIDTPLHPSIFVATGLLRAVDPFSCTTPAPPPKRASARPTAAIKGRNRRSQGLALRLAHDLRAATSILSCARPDRVLAVLFRTTLTALFFCGAAAQVQSPPGKCGAVQLAVTGGRRCSCQIDLSGGAGYSRKGGSVAGDRFTEILAGCAG